MKHILNRTVPFTCELCLDTGVFLKKGIVCKGPCACSGDCKDQHILCECVKTGYHKLEIECVKLIAVLNIILPSLPSYLGKSETVQNVCLRRIVDEALATCRISAELIEKQNSLILLDISNKVSTREKAINLKGEVHCVTTTELPESDI